MTLADGLAARLAAAVGADAISLDPADCAAVAHDLWPRALIQARQGHPPPPPDCVVWPRSAAEVAAVYRACAESGTPVTPFGAGTGVCGAAIPVRGGVVLDLKRMSAILDWDLVSGHVRVEPGILGIELERECLARGWTTGHYPSSLRVSTIGGFLATRSVGQLSTRYGRIDDLVAGLEVVLSDGTRVRCRPQPAAGAGLDLRRLFLGSEGSLGTITEVTLRVFPAPQSRVDVAVLFASFHPGVESCREVLQAGLRPSLLRLYDPEDTALQADHLGIGEGRGALLLAACEGRASVARAEADEVTAICLAAGGAPLDPAPVATWYLRRYDIGFQQARYLPVAGTVLDTIEVAAPWACLEAVHSAVKDRLRDRLVVFCHLSHGYPDGACLYFTFAGFGEESAALGLHEQLWSTVMATTLEMGGSIAHHHGAGLARAPWLLDELGEGGLEVLSRLKFALDPAGIANPGKWGLDR